MLTKKEIQILMKAFVDYNCVGCMYKEDKSVCSCDIIYEKLMNMEENISE